MAKYTTDNLTADGRSGLITMKNSPRGNGSNITRRVTVVGTFGGGTATLQISDDRTTWRDVHDESGAVTFDGTGSGDVIVDVPSDPENPSFLSINLSGATSPDISFTVWDAA